MTYYDSDELLMLCESAELLETLVEMRRILVCCAKSKNIRSEHIKDSVKSFNTLNEMAHQFSKNSCYKFYKKYNFFKPGIKIAFLS